MLPFHAGKFMLPNSSYGGKGNHELSHYVFGKLMLPFAEDLGMVYRVEKIAKSPAAATSISTLGLQPPLLGKATVVFH